MRVQDSRACLLQEYKSQREVSIHYPSSGQSGIEDNTHRYGVGWAELPNLPGLRLATDITLMKDVSADTPQTPVHAVGNQGNRLTLRVHNKVRLCTLGRQKSRRCYAWGCSPSYEPAGTVMLTSAVASCHKITKWTD